MDPLLIGVVAALCTIVIHGLMVGLIVWEVRRNLARGRLGPTYAVNLGFVALATMLALVAHLLEMGLWAVVFQLCGEFPDFATSFYHSAVNYTTLGYGDIVMSAHWKLLGPLEAADGMLMFGVSTAVIFAVIQRLIQTRLGLSE